MIHLIMNSWAQNLFEKAKWAKKHMYEMEKSFGLRKGFLLVFKVAVCFEGGVIGYGKGEWFEDLDR